MTDIPAPEPDETEEAEPAPEPRPSVDFDRRMLEFLVCPVTRGPLLYDADRRELVSPAAGLAFRIKDGIPLMLVEEARRTD